MLRDGGLGDAGQLRESAGAQFVMEQARDNLGAGGITERMKDSSEATSCPLVKHPRAARRFTRIVDTWRRAR